MATENVNLGWLKDYQNVKFAPATVLDQVLTGNNSTGGKVLLSGAAAKNSIGTAGTVGSSSQPIYLDSGVPKPVTSAGQTTNSLTLQFNSGTTEGSNKYTFNGSAAKAINIKPGTGLSMSNSSGTITITNSGSATLTGSPGASKTITAFSESNGSVSATFGDISIAPSQINNTIGVGKGGTGATTFTTGALLQGNGTNAISIAGAKGSVTKPIYIDTNGISQTINALNILYTGTGVLGKDNGAGTSPRYTPSVWTFNTGVSSLSDGDIFIIKIPVAGCDYGVWLSVQGDTNANYHPVVIAGTGKLTTQYAVNTVIAVVYEVNGTTTIIPKTGKANTTGSSVTGVFRILNYRDVNTLLRTYKSSTNLDVPLLAQSSAASTTAKWSSYGTSTYKDWYGVIPQGDNQRVTINLSTGTLKTTKNNPKNAEVYNLGTVEHNWNDLYLNHIKVGTRNNQRGIFSYSNERINIIAGDNDNVQSSNYEYYPFLGTLIAADNDTHWRTSMYFHNYDCSYTYNNINSIYNKTFKTGGDYGYYLQVSSDNWETSGTNLNTISPLTMTFQFPGNREDNNNDSSSYIWKNSSNTNRRTVKWNFKVEDFAPNKESYSVFETDAIETDTIIGKTTANTITLPQKIKIGSWTIKFSGNGIYVQNGAGTNWYQINYTSTGSTTEPS